MPVRRKELLSSFWQRLWRSRLNPALGRLYVQTHRRLQRCRLNLRLGSALDRDVPSLSRGSLNFPQRQKCNRWYIDFRLRCERNVNRSIGTPKDEIASKQPSDRTRTQEFNAIGEGWPTQHLSRPPPVRLKRDRALNRAWPLNERQTRDRDYCHLGGATKTQSFRRPLRGALYFA